MIQCGICNNIKCRCQDCYALIEKMGKWWCNDAEDWCEDIKCCLSYDEESGCVGVINEQ